MPSRLISVIVCSRNGGEQLLRTLHAVLKAVDDVESPCEVLAVDSASSDDTPALIRTLAALDPRVRVVVEDLPGLSRARNAGLRAASGDVLVFTDDDCLPETGWLSRLSSPLVSGHADVAAGAVRLAPGLERSWFTPFHRQMLASTEQGLGDPPRTVVGANMAFRRAALSDLTFDVRLGAGALGCMEESLVFEQMRSRGAVATFVGDAVIVHHFDPLRLEPKSFVQRAYVQGRGEGWMHWNWGRAGHTRRSYARWLRLELKLLAGGSQRRLAGSAADLSFVREIGRRREYARSRWLRRDEPVGPSSPQRLENSSVVRRSDVEG